MTPHVVLRMEGMPDADLGPLGEAINKLIVLVARSIARTGDNAESARMLEAFGKVCDTTKDPLSCTSAALFNAHVCLESSMDAFKLEFDAKVISTEVAKGNA